MKILLLTEWFQPEPAFKGLPFARELAAAGHKVQVLTGFPNYPGGKLYPGYRVRLWQREVMDGIEVIRVPVYPSHDRSGLRRAFTYLSFFASASLLGTALVRRPDVIYAYHPPLTTGLAALFLGGLRRAPVVYDIQDLWPDTVLTSGMCSSRRAVAILNGLCNLVYRKATHITVLSPGFRETLIRRGVPACKIDVIYNWADEDKAGAPIDSGVVVGRPGRFTILFAGTMGTVQGLDSVLGAAQICATLAPSIDFVFLGGGVERDRLQAMAADLHLENVRFLPRQPLEAMGAILAQADALLVHLMDDPLFRITIPSKLQAYLAAGKPVLVGCRGDAADLVTRAGAGMVCEPGNSASIAETAARLAACSPQAFAEMGRSGLRFYRRELSIARGVGEFLRIFAQAAHGSSSIGSQPAESFPTGEQL